MGAKNIADQVRNASSPAEVERITKGLSPEQTDAVVRELNGGQK